MTREFIGRAVRKRRVVGLLLAADGVALLVATLGATYLRFGRLDAAVLLQNTTVHATYWQASLILTGLWMLSLAYERLYELERLTWGGREFSRVFRALAAGVVVFILATYALKMPGLSRTWTLLAFTLAVVLAEAGRLAVRTWLTWTRQAGRMHRRTLIVGSNAEAARIIRHLFENPDQGLTPVGYLTTTKDELPLALTPDDVPVLGVARDVVSAVREHAIDTVIISGSAFTHEVISHIINDLRGIDVTIHMSSGLFDVLTSRVLVRDVGGVPLVTVTGVALGPAALRTKRVFDLVVASAVLVVGLPLWLLLALAIVLDSRGPIFYKQARVGQGGTPFGMYKFRSMVNDADARLAQLVEDNEATGPLFKMKYDPRVTRVGRWLRKYSIDEFPQLLNVLRGEMSLVGPRPPLLVETEQYSDYHWRRMEVPPGLTGLWQVSGRSSLTFDEMIRLDLFYIENWSVAFDMSLLLRTLPAIVFSRGAY